MTVTFNGIDTAVSSFGEINLAITLDCGQAFRWEALADGSFYGLVRGHETRVKLSSGALIFMNTSEEDTENIWIPYFDLNTDYAAVIEKISADETVNESVNQCGTIRILRQEPWETLCSFIISACNNIPRIKGIIGRLCTLFGEPVGNGFTFPSPAVLAEKSEEELAVLRAGYRAPYIIDAARKTASGEIDLDALINSDEEYARRELMKIKGVGRKVADCTLLFGLGFRDVFPVDRHILRAQTELYPSGLPECFSGNKGLAQQYIFNRQRTKNT